MKVVGRCKKRCEARCFKGVEAVSKNCRKTKRLKLTWNRLFDFFILCIHYTLSLPILQSCTAVCLNCWFGSIAHLAESHNPRTCCAVWSQIRNPKKVKVSHSRRPEIVWMFGWHSICFQAHGLRTSWPFSIREKTSAHRSPAFLSTMAEGEVPWQNTWCLNGRTINGMSTSQSNAHNRGVSNFQTWIHRQVDERCCRPVSPNVKAIRIQHWFLTRGQAPKKRTFKKYSYRQSPSSEKRRGW